MLNLEYLREFEMQVRLEEAREDGIQEGRKEGIQKEKLGLARSFRELGVAIEKIMQATGLSKEVIETL